MSPKDTSGNPIYTQGFLGQRSKSVHQRDPGRVRRARRAGGRRHRQPGGVPFRPGDFVFPSGPVRLYCARSALAVSRRKRSHVSEPGTGGRSEEDRPRSKTSHGEEIVTPDGTLLSGYPFDGGFMQPSGIPTRDIGTATSPPGNIGLGSGNCRCSGLPFQIRRIIPSPSTTIPTSVWSRPTRRGQ